MRRRLPLVGSWAFWWLAATVFVVLWVRNLADACRVQVDAGHAGACLDTDRAAYDALGAVQLGAIVVGLGGAVLLMRLQKLSNSRPCVACGHRVPNGEVECWSCGSVQAGSGVNR